MSWKNTTGQSYNHGRPDILTASLRDCKVVSGLGDPLGRGKSAKLLDRGASASVSCTTASNRGAARSKTDQLMHPIPHWPDGRSPRRRAARIGSRDLRSGGVRRPTPNAIPPCPRQAPPSFFTTSLPLSEKKSQESRGDPEKTSYNIVRVGRDPPSHASRRTIARISAPQPPAKLALRFPDLEGED
jgi:hypothetical protein